MKYTPSFIKELGPNEAIVLNSDRKFHDEVWNERLFVSTSALENGSILEFMVSDSGKLCPLMDIKKRLAVFFKTARREPKVTFYLSKIGFAAGQYRVEDLVDVYAKKPDNVCVPLQMQIALSTTIL